MREDMEYAYAGRRRKACTTGMKTLFCNYVACNRSAVRYNSHSKGDREVRALSIGIPIPTALIQTLVGRVEIVGW